MYQRAWPPRLDLENMDIAVGILFLVCLQAEIWLLPVWDRHIGLHIAGYVIQQSR